jgi:hypothetical protein
MIDFWGESEVDAINALVVRENALRLEYEHRTAWARPAGERDREHRKGPIMVRSRHGDIQIYPPPRIFGPLGEEGR